ncbi:peptidoglycan D,D-transpeptidase FtsI family protein [Paenibacillus sp. GCM10027626]|uniref:peptidoglycan D,D-transpeptidase FtsI family protein n=1 Tax=Paenibacillus sp. GCM10027626 TaxID=3273411 RepID=UPI00363092F5
MNRKEQRTRMDRRIAAILAGASVLLAFLLLRLGWVQWFAATAASGKQANWQQKAVLQREQTLVLDTGRGDFADRYGRPLTGTTYQALAAFPIDQQARGSREELGRLAAALEVTEERLTMWLAGLREPKFWLADGESVPLALTSRQVEAIKSLRVEGVRLLPYRNRYSDQTVARHAIGYISQHPEWIQQQYAAELANRKIKVNEQIGGSGLEKAFNPLLRGAGATSVMFYRDGRNKPLHGLDLRYTGPDNPYYPLEVITTIDAGIQQELEQYVDESGLREGAVVVLDARNGDIVAMISRPQMEPNALGAAHTDLANHALREAVPGSVFKLVTEAAALEAGLTAEREQFECSGDYGKYGLHCWKKGGHGKLSLQDALAQSCNIAFAALAERLQPSDLLKTADQLGIGRRIGWYSGEAFAPLTAALRLMPEEEAGRIFAVSPEKRDGGQLAQTGIGQRDVKMSPLQAANLMVTLLHNGQVFMPRLVTEIRYANGQRLSRLDTMTAPSVYGAVKPATVQTLLRGLKAVVDEGTGKALQSNDWRLAGKSGTAETVKDGKTRNHHWFTGFGPVESPRYAVAVLMENQPLGISNKATVLFGGIMSLLAGRDSMAR